MINALSTTNTTVFKDTFRDAMVAAGKIATIHYDSGNSLVFTPTDLTRVIKLTNGSWYVGDAWTSTTTITNQLLLYTPYTAIASGMEIVLITGPGYFCISLQQQSPIFISILLFTKDTDNRELFIGYGQASAVSYNNLACYDLISREELYPAIRPTGLLTDNTGLLFMMEVVMKNSGSLVRTTSIPNVKVVSKPPDTATHQAYGNDVTVPATYTADGGYTLNANLLLIGGAV